MRYFNEIKVGIVVMVGLFIMVFGYFWLRGVGLGAEKYYIRLNGAAQIAQGNDVRLQGVKIGQVAEVGFDPETQQPILELAVRRSNPPFKLLRTYVYSVQSSSLVGENYVDIRGKYDPSGLVFLPATPNGTIEYIPGQASGGILAVTNGAGDVVKEFRTTMQKLNVTIDRINKGVLNYENQVKLTRTLEGVARLTANASQSFGPEGVKVGFGDPNAQRNLNRALQNAQIASQSAAAAARNIEVTTRDFGGVPGEARGLVRDLRITLNGNRGQLNGLVGNLNRTSNNIAGITETLDFALRQGGFQQNAQLAFQSLRRAAENVEVATGGLRKLGEDQSTQADLKRTVTALRESTEALRDTAVTVKNAISDDKTKGQLGGVLTSLGSTAKNLENVTAGLSNIVGDASLQENVKGAAANLNSTLAATRAAAERVNGLLGGRRPKTSATTPGAPGSGNERGAGNVAAPAAFPTGVNLTYRRYLETPNRRGASDVSGRNYTDLTFNGEFFGGPFRAGLANLGDGTDVTLQSGKFFGNNAAARYGLYRSELGAGVELRRGRLSVEGNIWNPNNRSYNLYGGVQVNKNVQIIAGRENLRGDGVSSIGVRITQ